MTAGSRGKGVPGRPEARPRDVRPRPARRPLMLGRHDLWRFSAAIPSHLRGRWCLVRIGGTARPDAPPFRLRVGRAVRSFAAGEELRARRMRLPGAGTIQWAVAFVPEDGQRFHFDVFGVEHGLERLPVNVTPIPRAQALLARAAGSPDRVLRALWGPPRGTATRIRSALFEPGLERAGPGYPDWIALYDSWTDSDRDVLLSRLDQAGGPAASVLVFDPGGKGGPALEATLASLRAQWRAGEVRVVAGAPSLSYAGLLDGLAGDYVALVQAGDTLPPHAIALLLDHAVAEGWPDAIFADEDALDAEGQRADPLFKPQASRMLMLSGTLTRGVWLIRRACLRRAALPGPGFADAPVPAWGEAARLDLWLRLWEARPDLRTTRVPFVLTHRRADAPAAPAAALGRVVRDHLGRTGATASVEDAALPVRVAVRPPEAVLPPVSLVVPTTATAGVAGYLHAILARTAYPRLELLLVVSQDRPLDAEQRAVLDPLLADARARLVLRDAARFNYSAAVNRGVAEAAHDHVCLLNDDVEPLAPDWLSLLAGQLLADPRAGAAGAKLLYPDGTVQHGGVILGIGLVCEHAQRLLPAGEGGYGHRAVLDQEYSAVTGACLLTTRTLYRRLGGLDEAYPRLFNDIDFCLRARQAGRSVLFSAHAALVHHESLSFGHERGTEHVPAGWEDAQRMYASWSAACADDPFYNPNLSLAQGQEWSLAFPPRVRRPFAPGAPGRAVPTEDAAARTPRHPAPVPGAA